MLNKSKVVFLFHDFRLETAEARLAHENEFIPLSPKAFSLLVLLIERAGQLVDKDEILRTLWPDSFVEEANLTVHISALRKALANFDEAQFIETVPRRGYRFVAPVTVVEPQQPQPAATTTSDAASSGSGKRWIWGMAGAALLLAGILARWEIGRSATVMPTAIAVLPFQSLSGQSPADRYLALGMADALINRLSMLRNFNVRTTGQVSQFDKPGVDAPAAARDLRVDWVLTGSIQHLDNRLRVTVQLTRAKDGSTVWAEKYDEFFTNMFAVQDDISEKLARTLAPKLSGQDQRTMTRRYTENTDVFRLYAQGRVEMQRFLPDSIAKARDLFEQAIALDPSYPMSYIGLADVLVTSWYREPENRDRYTARARECVAILRKLDPELPEAYLASGWVEQFIDHNWSAAEADFHRALAINPNLADAHASLGWLMESLARLSEAEQSFRRAFELNPVGEGYGLRLAIIVYQERRFEDALKLARSVRDENPSALYATTVADTIALCLIHLGRPAEAIQEVDRAVDGQYRGTLATKARIYALAGRREQAATLMQQAVTGPRQNSAAVAVAALALGDREEAFRLLSMAVDRGEAGANMLKADIDIAPLRTDPRFKTLLARMNLPQN